MSKRAREKRWEELRNAAAMRNLKPVILEILDENPGGIMFETLVDKTRKRGCDYPSHTVYKACKELANGRRIRVEEWEERVYYNTYSAYQKRHKYFPIG
ncbi:MAG: hypothetical protein O2V44_02535 [Candidatus Bathyarchaeota archaeon]|nr:hypothetical protein [Candidatus Bathyarchaeota archaeon]